MCSLKRATERKLSCRQERNTLASMWRPLETGRPRLVSRVVAITLRHVQIIRRVESQGRAGRGRVPGVAQPVQRGVPLRRAIAVPDKLHGKSSCQSAGLSRQHPYVGSMAFDVKAKSAVFRMPRPRAVRPLPLGGIVRPGRPPPARQGLRAGHSDCRALHGGLRPAVP